MASPQTRVIVVMAATGNQGSGVIRALLNNKLEGSPWHVRGVTRDIDSQQARELLEQNQTADGCLLSSPIVQNPKS